MNKKIELNEIKESNNDEEIIDNERKKMNQISFKMIRPNQSL